MRERECVCVCVRECFVHSSEEFPAEPYNDDATVLRQIAATFFNLFPESLNSFEKKSGQSLKQSCHIPFPSAFTGLGFRSAYFGWP